MHPSNCFWSSFIIISMISFINGFVKFSFFRNCMKDLQFSLNCRLYKVLGESYIYIVCKGYIRVFTAFYRLRYTVLQVLVTFKHCRVIQYFKYRTAKLRKAAVWDKTYCVTTFQIVFYRAVYMIHPVECGLNIGHFFNKTENLSPPLSPSLSWWPGPTPT